MSAARTQWAWATAAAVVVSLGLLSGCAGSEPKAGPSPGVSAHPTVSASPSPPETAAICTIGQLQPWAGLTGAATALIATTYGFTNTSDQPCSRGGFATVQLLNSSGGELPTSDQPFRVSPGGSTLPLVLRRPGGRAYFQVFYPVDAEAPPVTCPTSAGLRFVPPGLPSSLTLTGAGAAITPYGWNSATPCGIVLVTALQASLPFPHPSPG